MKKYFVTSDVHGYFDQFLAALDNAGFDKTNDEHILIVCGDLFDRGSKPKEILEYVQNLGDRFVFIRGNHEDLLIKCVSNIVDGYSIGYHHFSNGTVYTIALFSDVDYNSLRTRQIDETIRSHIKEAMNPVLEWIIQKSIDYYETPHHIFVHGWIPFTESMRFGLPPTPLKNWRTDTVKYDWEAARWINGAKAWNDGIVEPNKTIVCGHWHTSYAHSWFHGNGSEFGEDACFNIFKDKGIIMLDACTAYSGKVNCLVLSEDEI